MKRTIRILLAAAALAAGCSSQPTTELEVTWVTPQPPPAKSFKKLLIISVATSEFVQIAFQDQMAKELKARGVNAVPSHLYFTRYTDAEKARFMNGVAASDADFILLARVTNTAQQTYEDRGTIIGPLGQPYADGSGIQGAYARYIYPASYVAMADGTVKTVTAEASIFAKQGDKLVWSARTRTKNAQGTTGENYAPQYIGVIIDAMKKDKLL